MIFSLSATLLDSKASYEEVELSIYSSGSWNSSIYGIGHSFLMFKNVSGSNIYVGGMKLENGDSLTLGTSSSSVFEDIWDDADSGITYNKEYTDSFLYGPSTAPSLTITIDSTDILAINDLLEDDDEYNAFTDNCTHFALDVWNLVAPTGKQMIWDDIPYIDKISTPMELEANIKEDSDYEIDKTVEGTFNMGYVKDSTNSLELLMAIPSVTLMNRSHNSLTFKYTNATINDLVLFADLSSIPNTYRGVLPPGDSIQLTYSETYVGTSLLQGTSYFTYAKFINEDYDLESHVIRLHGTTSIDTGGGTIEPWKLNE